MAIAVVVWVGGTSAAQAWQLEKVAGEAQVEVQAAQRFIGLGAFGRKVTTTSASAQEFFDQGLCFLYAFNHDEAIRSFDQATRDDPNCAMAWWGIAIANGPHINKPMVSPEQSDAAQARAAFDAAWGTADIEIHSPCLCQPGQ